MPYRQTIQELEAATLTNACLLYTSGETTGVGSANGEAGTHPLNRTASTAMILRLRFFRCIVFPFSYALNPCPAHAY